MESETTLPIEILHKIAANLATVLKVRSCYCYGGIFVSDMLCDCTRARYQAAAGVADLVAFSATCKRFRREFGVREGRLKMIRRRLLFLTSLVDMRVLFAIGNNLAAAEHARLAATQRLGRVQQGAGIKTIPLLDALAEIEAERRSSMADSNDGARHLPVAVGKIKTMAFRPRFCGHTDQKRIPHPPMASWERHTVVQWCLSCQLAISTDEEDRTISAEW